MNDFTQYRKAITFAVKQHSCKKRDNELLYIVHPLRVCTILRSFGYNEYKNPDMVISALFHDLIEDTEITKEDIEREFNSTIAQIVYELTKKETETKIEYLKTLKYASKEAKIIKMADRIDNLLDLPYAGWKKEDKIKYANQGKLILKYCGSENIELSQNLSEVINTILEKM